MPWTRTQPELAARKLRPNKRSDGVSWHVDRVAVWKLIFTKRAGFRARLLPVGQAVDAGAVPLDFRTVELLAIAAIGIDAQFGERILALLAISRAFARGPWRSRSAADAILD